LSWYTDLFHFIHVDFVFDQLYNYSLHVAVGADMGQVRLPCIHCGRVMSPSALVILSFRSL